MSHKKTVLILCGLLALGAVHAQTVAALSPPADNPRAGTVKSVRGEVKLESAGAPARSAAAGDGVEAVDHIQTGADSGASVIMRDGTALVLGPSSRLDLKDFHFDSTTQEGGLLVSLLRGSLRMVSGLIGKTRPEAVKVETPTAVIGIRGTDFIVETDPQQ